jgi:hypothetical protein
MTRGVGGQLPANVQKFLAGVEYPASKQELVEQAKNNKAPQEVLEVIEDLPGEEFAGPQEVVKAFGEIK